MIHHTTRREFLAGAAAAALAPRLAHASVADAKPESEESELEEFDYGAVELTGGPLKEQYDRIHAAYLALDNDRLLQVYRERAGLPAPGATMGGWYGRDGFVPGHSLGQYISGLARFGRATGDEACHTKVHDLVQGFAYTLGNQNQIYAAPNAEKLWPCYILDKHLIGLIDACQLSGVEQARTLTSRVFAGALPYIPAQGRDRLGKKDPPYDETYVLPENLFLAHILTGDRALYDRARTYLLDREFFDPLAAGEDALPGRHAYSHVIALSSAGKAHLVLGADKYLSSMRNAWELLRANQQYATGGWGPNELFVEPHQGQLYASLFTTEDHFETPCGSYAAIKLARYLLCATGDARYGDGLERVVLNGVLAVKEPDADGDYPYYSSYNAKARKAYYPQRWPCCSGTLVQGVADYVKNIYFRAPDGVAVNLYAPSRVRWQQGETTVALSQETSYPLLGSIGLNISCDRPVEFRLQLRIPQWAQGAPALRVNGKSARITMRRGFAVLARTWNSGDKIELELPMNFRSEPIDDLHERTVAVLRGPLVYVELDPANQSSHLDLATLQSASDASGAAAAGSRRFAPFFQVREETYTMYFDHA
jgi:uncharacterized protein